MDDSNIRVISLLPSTTEIIARLGLENLLVVRSHACDFPASVQTLPACTGPKFNAYGQSYEIDQRVKVLLQEGLSVFRVDAERQRLTKWPTPLKQEKNHAYITRRWRLVAWDIELIPNWIWNRI